MLKIIMLKIKNNNINTFFYIIIINAKRKRYTT